MSTPAPTPPTTPTNPTATPKYPKTLNLLPSQGNEPIGFGLLMSPYKAKLVDVEALTADFLKRAEQITQGQSTSGSTEDIQKKTLKNISAADLKFQATLYSSKEIRESDQPRIIFPLPVDIRDQLMINYQSSDLGVAGAAASFGSDLARNLKQGKGLDMGADTLASALSAVGLSIAPDAIRNLAGQYLGAVVNPFTVTAFRNVEPRVFNFEFRITPIDRSQSEELQECINTLRYCALPEPTAAGLTLAFPYRFKLAWLGALKMFDFSEAILSRIEVNYASAGMPSFFEYTVKPRADGSVPGFHPVAVTITLEFRELFPLTKESVVPTGKSTSNYAGEMTPRHMTRSDFEEQETAPPSSPATNGGATNSAPPPTANPNQTGNGDDQLATPNASAATAAAKKARYDAMQAAVITLDKTTAQLTSTQAGGFDAARVEQGQLSASALYQKINEHNVAAATYNANLAVEKTVNPGVQALLPQKTWLTKVRDGESGSKTSYATWDAYYRQGQAQKNKTGGGG